MRKPAGRRHSQQLVERVLEFARERPYVAIGASAALGYILGGGLFTRTTSRLVGVGAQLATWPAVQQRLLEVVENAVFAAHPEP